MAYIRTIPEDDASGLLAEVYAQRRALQGSVPNHMKAMSLRPAAIQAWQDLVTAVRSPLDTRTYELVTIATASALRCSY
jgi:alkylhydroperoxidase/carboxymuconolactone decarboxylase family protein YurZ